MEHDMVRRKRLVTGCCDCSRTAYLGPDRESQVCPIIEDVETERCIIVGQRHFDVSRCCKSGTAKVVGHLGDVRGCTI